MAHGIGGPHADSGARRVSNKTLSKGNPLLAEGALARIRKGYMASTRPRSPILLVDDDPDVRESMKSLLELDGYAVTTARDGEDAMNQLKSGLRPCVILLDLMMPRKDGFQFRTEQLEDPEIAPIPVIVYSGHYDVEQNTAMLAAAAYLQKPIRVETLLDKVATCCRR